MKPWVALYLKELRENRNLFLFAVAASVAVDVYAITNSDSEAVTFGKSAPYFLLCVLPAVASVLLLPFMLAHSFSSEWKADTHYQMLSLPVPKFAVCLCKWLAVLSIGVALFVVTTTGMYLMYLEMLEVGSRVPPLSAVDFWTFVGAVYFPVLILLLGMVCQMEGLKFAVKRLRGAVTIGSFACSVYLYGKLMKPAQRALAFLGDRQIPDVVMEGNRVFVGVQLWWVVYCVLGG